MLNQIFFSVYEFFTNIIPGSVILVSLTLFNFDFFSLVAAFSETEVIRITLFLFAAFIIGSALQAISKIIIDKIPLSGLKKYKKPSEHYLQNDDPTFPLNFKNEIKQRVNEMFDPPIKKGEELTWSETNIEKRKKNEARYFFDMCHTYLKHVGADAKAQVFMRIYSFARSMIAAMLVEILFFGWLWWMGQLTFSNLFFISMILFGLSYAFYRLFVHYDNTFTKEVFLTFFMKTTKNVSNS